MTATAAYVEREGSEFATYDDFAVEYRSASHRYWMWNDATPDRPRYEVPSVTGILRILDKPALLRWAEAKGAEGVARVMGNARRHAETALQEDRHPTGVLRELLGTLEEVTTDPEDAVELVRARRLGADAVRDAGGERGSLVHSLQETYVETGSPPKLSDYDPENRGFVQAYCKWLLHAKPEPVACEQRVGSVKHGFAGTFDLWATITWPDGSREEGLVDLKTGRGRVYREAWLQLGGYRVAFEESYGVRCAPPGLVVALDADGNYTPSPVPETGRHFLAVLRAFKAVREVDALMKGTA